MGPANDSHVEAMAVLAGEQGAEVSVIDTPAPTFARWGWRNDDGRLHDHRGEEVRLDAVYVRSVASPLPRHESDEVAGPDMARWLGAAERGRRAQIHARAVNASLEMSGTLVVNPMATSWFHRSKPAADLRLRAAGIAGPRCLVTDDPAELRRFVEAVGDAGVIRKPVGGGGYCDVVDPDKLTDADLAGMVTAPVLFQERIRGDDLRVYVLDGEVIAAGRIYTTAIDYRGHEDDVVGITADDELADLCCRVADTLDLVFTGIDVKRSADGALTVLDANPSPMFLAFERRMGQPVGERLAALLVAAAGRRKMGADA
jgi:glutathione synthase/RimK-type ligase-like ATP-grasp enzyme